ncbi:hypothetical protein [Nonomuraea sp. NPDC049784]|uniref:hypothetical protein n=1 Tax=Nonomuraea sp. NPDC049784 TaxID=3154361 RepID=UPI00340BA4B4
MVGLVRGRWNTPRKPIALVGVMCLAVLCVLLPGTSYAWGSADAGTPRGPSSSAAWSPDAWDADLSSLPPQATGVREHHTLSLWPLQRGEGPLRGLGCACRPGDRCSATV